MEVGEWEGGQGEEGRLLSSTIRLLFSLKPPVTSAADNGGHKQSQVTVVQLQGVEARGKLELGLHHVTKRPPEALEELSGDEAPAVGHQEAIFVHAGGQEGEEGLVYTVLQQSHLRARQAEEEEVKI